MTTITAWIAIFGLLYALFYALLHAGTLRGQLDAANSRLVGEKQRRLAANRKAEEATRRADELERRNSYMIMESVGLYHKIDRLEVENAYLRSHYLTRKGLVAGTLLTTRTMMAGKLEIVGEVSAP